MTGTRKYWKSRAKNSLHGKWGTVIAAMLTVQIVNVIGNLLSQILFSGDTRLSVIFSEIFAFAISLIGAVVTTGYCHLRLRILRGKKYGMKHVWYAFNHHPDRVLIAAFVVALLNTAAQIPTYLVTFLTDPGTTLAEISAWCLSVVAALAASTVLSIVLTVPFALTFYFLADDPEMGGLEALNNSVRYMKGHMWQYLKLELSFVPLILLSMFFTMGIGFLWLIPYMDCTETSFYMYVTGEFDQNNNSNEGEDNGYYSGDNQGA